jgi:OPA family sugar phosphate sensor protein UhpC-like MFS transporter
VYDVYLNKRLIFLVAYVTYAFSYLARLNFSVVMPILNEGFGFSKFSLGLIGGAYSFSYAIGQFVHGQLVEKYGPKRIILIGLLLSSLMNFLFGYVDSLVLFVIVWAINGFAQAAGWPSVIKMVSTSFNSRFGKIGGFFGSCFLVGNVVAWPIIGYAVSNFGWRMAFAVPSIVLLIFAFIICLTIKDVASGSLVKVSGFGWFENFRKLISSRNIIVVALAFVLLQFVRSVFTLWAPTYLFERYSLSLEFASYFAVAIPFGGILGSIVSGWFLDRLRKISRRLILCLLVLPLSFTVLLLYNMPFGLVGATISLFLIGFTLYGPHVIMSAVIPMEFNETYGGASVAGFIDGLGYLGLMFADSFSGLLVDVYGWNSVLAFCFASSMSTVFLIASFYKEK